MSLGESDKKAFLDWASLPGPALNLISKCLTLDVDYVQFRSVCTLWRKAAPKRSMLPLLASFYAGRDDQNTSCVLSSFKDEQIVPIEIRLQNFPPHSLCFGSSHGWLALFDLGQRITLFNPITKSQIHLPPLNPISTSMPSITALQEAVPVGIALSANPSLGSNFLVLQLTRNPLFPLAYLRYGDGSWTSIRHFWPSEVDFALFYEGRLVFVRNYVGGCVVCARDLRQQDIKVDQILVPSPPESDQIFDRFLLESSGDLLLAIAYGVTEIVEDEEEDSDSEEEVCLLDVFRVDFTGEKMKLVKVEDLGDCSIFLGANHSICVSASRYPACRQNSIYCAHYNVSPYTPMIYRVSIGDSDNQMIGWPNSLHPLRWKLLSMWVNPSLLS